MHCELVLGEITDSGESAIAVVTGERKFHGMHSLVQDERAGLRASIIALITGVRPFAGMNTHVRL